MNRMILDVQLSISVLVLAGMAFVQVKGEAMILGPQGIDVIRLDVQAQVPESILNELLAGAAAGGLPGGLPIDELLRV